MRVVLSLRWVGRVHLALRHTTVAGSCVDWNNGEVPTSSPQSFYDAVGGHDTFVRIVGRFYAGVADDPLLRPMYPDDDLSEPAAHLTMFLEQYWGGPTTYSQSRGHPRLGMRHAPFAVTPAARDAWLTHMRAALEESGMSAEHIETFWEYVLRAAHFLVNSPDEQPVARTLDVH
jgi:hemoglobin